MKFESKYTPYAPRAIMKLCRIRSVSAKGASLYTGTNDKTRGEKWTPKKDPPGLKVNCSIV
jgi:hypothetical protein